MKKGQVPSPSSPMSERDNQWDPEILIIPLCPSAETPKSQAEGAVHSSVKEAKPPCKIEPLQPLSQDSQQPTANGRLAGSVKQLQSLFEREHFPQPLPASLSKNNPKSHLHGGNTKAIKELQSLFQRETTLTAPVPSSNKTTMSPVNGEHATSHKEEKEHIPQPMSVPLSNKTTTPPVNGEHAKSHKEERKHTPQPISVPLCNKTTTLTANDGSAHSPKDERERVPQPIPITSCNKTTLPVNGEHANSLKAERKPSPQPTSITPSNQATAPPVNGGNTSSPKDEREHTFEPMQMPITSRNMSPTSPVNGEHASTPKDKGALTPQLVTDTSNYQTPTSPVNVEHAASLEDFQSPTKNQVAMDLLPSALARPELLQELKKGKHLRPTQQNRGLTTVFSGNGKFKRRVSTDSGDSTVSSPDSDGSQNFSPSAGTPNGQAQTFFPRKPST